MTAGLKEISFTVYGSPIALKRHRTVKAGFRQYDPSAPDKADFLAKALQYKPDKPIDKPIQMRMRFYFSRPKSHFNKKGLRADAPEIHTNAPDADNLEKFVWDSLAGIFFTDDKLIWTHSSVKLYDECPRVEITIFY